MGKKLVKQKNIINKITDEKDQIKNIILRKQSHAQTGLPTQKDSDFFAKETGRMAINRREIEKNGQRKFAIVKDKEHADEELLNANQASAFSDNAVLDNGIQQHPLLADTQRYDGSDPDVNPAPPLNTEARKKYDEELNKQEKEKQLRLELSLNNKLSKNFSPQFNPNPKPF